MSELFSIEEAAKALSVPVLSLRSAAVNAD